MGFQTFQCPVPRPFTGSLRLAGPPAPGVEALGADASVLEEALNLLGSGGLAAKPCRQRGPLSRTLAFTAFFAARPRSRSSALLRNRQLLHVLIPGARARRARRAEIEEHTSELQSLMRISYAVFCLKKKNK